MMRVSKAWSCSVVGAHGVEYRHTPGGAIDPIKLQTMQMYVQIGGRSEALYKRYGASIGLGTL